MNSDPDWSLYRTLLAVIEDGSLSGAARRLGLTQPTVARHVDALEAAAGADLFVRTQRGLTPTDLALSLKPYAEMIASTAAALLRVASGPVGEITGTVRISASDIAGVEHLPPVLAQLRRDHPGLVIELALTDRGDDLLQREADIAVRMTEPTQGALVARRLPAIDLGFHAHRDYVVRRGTPTTLADLAGHDLIGFDTETPAMRGMMTHLPGLSRSNFALRSDSNLAQLAAIRAGFGIGFCQVVVARNDHTLVRLLDAINFPLPLWIVMHENLKTTARYRVVFDALVLGMQAATSTGR